VPCGQSIGGYSFLKDSGEFITCHNDYWSFAPHAYGTPVAMIPKLPVTDFVLLRSVSSPYGGLVVQHEGLLSEEMFQKRKKN
jgi:hypothetical protein